MENGRLNLNLDSFNDCSLYLISPPKLQNDFLKNLELAVEFGSDFISTFQLRLKAHNNESILAWAQKIKPILAKKNIPLIINDNVEIALASSADGVHLGSDDCSVKIARSKCGNDFIIGASAYDSIEIAKLAAEKTADYVCFGAFFASTTKITKTSADVQLLRDWKTLFKLPAGAIGGINPKNAKEIIKAGADFIAVGGAIWQSKNITKTMEQFKAVIQSSKGENYD